MKTENNFYKKLISLTLPISFQSLMLASVAAADSFMLGRIDQTAMAAVSLATNVQFIQNMFVGSIAGASGVLAAQYWGKGDKKTVENIFCMILRLSGLVSLITCLACELFPNSLMKIFTNDPTMIEIGASYLKIAGWSYLLTGISLCYLVTMKLTDHARSSALISSTAVILNIILNACLIFGYAGLPKMLSDGAALATTISRIVEIILCLAISARKTYLSPTIRGLLTRHKELFKDYIKHLLPITGAYILWGGGITTYSSVIGHISIDATAASAIVTVVRELVCSLCNGVATAAEIIVGNELGKGDLETGKKYGMKCTVVSVFIGIFTCLLVIVSYPLAARFTVLDEVASSYLKKMMIIMGVYMIGRCINGVVINGVFTAGGDTKFDVYSLAVCMWGLSVPLAFLGAFVFNWPVILVYFFTCFDEVFKVPWVIFHYKKYKWVKDLTREIS